MILPGNEVVFSLETASDYLKDDRACAYGFKCLVVGYEWPPDAASYDGLKHLEAELAFLGGMCAASLMKKDLLLPGVEGNFVEGFFLVLEVFTEENCQKPCKVLLCPRNYFFTSYTLVVTGFSTI